MSTATEKLKARRPYAAPELKVYGSVRELTGNNSGFAAGDGGTMMVMA